MNIGEKIKNLREEHQLSQEELAQQINDTYDNIVKYENNELEPSLDKKLLIAQVLGVSLDDISYSIDKDVLPNKAIQKDEVQDDDETMEIVEPDSYDETPFLTSTIVYNEDIFNKLFKGNYSKYLLQTIISFVSYLIIGIYATFFSSSLIFIAIIGYGLALYSLIKLPILLIRFKKAKQVWLTQYGNVTKTYNYYEKYIEVISPNGEVDQYYYTDILRVLEKDNLIVCMINKPNQMILTIDKGLMKEEEIDLVRNKLKENSAQYMNLEKNNDVNQPQNKKIKNFNLWLLIITIITALSIFISNIIFYLLNLDLTLINQLLPYLVVLPIAILSIVMGIIAKAKFSISSKKNYIVGIIVIVASLLFIGVSVMQYKGYKAYNNDTLKDEISKMTNTTLPTDYLTIYYNSKENNVVEDEQNYQIKTYQEWLFTRKKEIESFQNSLNENGWEPKSAEYNLLQILSKNESDLKVEDADYYYLYQKDTDQTWVLNAYYVGAKTMIVIEYTIYGN